MMHYHGQQMKVDWEAFKRARKARDPRFDGKFFVASTTTKIYCRPSCNVPMIKDKYVRYFPNAAAATEAGYRPCLRCRPECAPGTPGWLGTSSTVSRALRLIEESGLEDGGVVSLAERLGIGSRHLRRLFLRHLGATPSAVAHTRRLHFAKKLIDETNLPMHQIALASGFGCVRRFNAAIHKTYKRTPTQIRRLAKQTAPNPANEYLFRLRFRPPYQPKRMLAFIAARATPGVEVVEDGTYRRSIAVGQSHGWLEASFDLDAHTLLLRVGFPDPRYLFHIVERVRMMFDLNADWLAIASILQEDPELGPRIAVAPGLRVPGCWSGFELATRAVLGQQITVKAATTLAGRIVKCFGQPCALAKGVTHLFPTPEALAEADLTPVGVTSARAATIRCLAREVRDGDLRFEGVVDTEDSLNRLRKVAGIGDWTARYIVMRGLGEPDAFPAGDLGLLRALSLKNASELELRAEAWRPWRAYAAMYLWQVPNEATANRSRNHELSHGRPSFGRRAVGVLQHGRVSAATISS
jgi:AraC family transcriptional regulator of adaptative response / DNA-3-methyladenine glycosylase II